MKKFAIMTAAFASQVGLTWIAYMAAKNQVAYHGWFVFLAMAYALSLKVKVD